MIETLKALSIIWLQSISISASVLADALRGDLDEIWPSPYMPPAINPEDLVGYPVGEAKAGDHLVWHGEDWHLESDEVTEERTT